MKIGTILLLALMILGSGFAHLHAELPSRCKAEDGNATKEEKKEKEVENKNEKEKPTTVEAHKKHIRIELSLKGYFEDPDAVSISIPTKNWAELKVTEPPVQGKRVKKAISCCGLNFEKIKQRLDLLPTCRCSIWTGRFFSELKLAETLAPMEKKELDRMEKYVRQDFERFNQIDLPYEKKAAAMTLKSYRDSLACHRRTTN